MGIVVIMTAVNAFAEAFGASLALRIVTGFIGPLSFKASMGEPDLKISVDGLVDSHEVDIVFEISDVLGKHFLGSGPDLISDIAAGDVFKVSFDVFALVVVEPMILKSFDIRFEVGADRECIFVIAEFELFELNCLV